MLSQQKELRGLLSQLADGILLGLALWVGHGLRFHAPDLTGWDLPRIGSFEGFAPLLVFVVILGPLILESCSVYRRSLLNKPGAFFFFLGQAMLLLLMMCGILIFMFKMGNLARGVVILFAVFGFVLISLRHFFLRNTLDFFFQ